MCIFIVPLRSDERGTRRFLDIKEGALHNLGQVPSLYNSDCIECVDARQIRCVIQTISVSTILRDGVSVTVLRTSQRVNNKLLPRNYINIHAINGNRVCPLHWSDVWLYPVTWVDTYLVEVSAFHNIIFKIKSMQNLIQRKLRWPESICQHPRLAFQVRDSSLKLVILSKKWIAFPDTRER